MSKTRHRVFAAPDAIGLYMAKRLLCGIRDARSNGKRFLLGCPTGRTPGPIYGAMAAALTESPHDLSHLTLVMMDEYVVQTDRGFEYVSFDMSWSCHHFARTQIGALLNRSLPAAYRLREDAIWFPDPRTPAAYDERIADAGGIDVFILASGAGDGHVAFNPPGSPRESRTRVVELSEQTRRDNLQTFPAFERLSKVPKHGVGVGIATIASARRAAMVVWGAGKQLTLRRILRANRYEMDWPATVIHECPAGEILSDRDAAGDSSVTDLSEPARSS